MKTMDITQVSCQKQITKFFVDCKKDTQEARSPQSYFFQKDLLKGASY